MNSRNNVGKILLVVVSTAIFLIMCFLIVHRMGSYVSIQTEIAMEKLSLEQDKQSLDQLEMLKEQEKGITDTIVACKKLMPGEPQLHPVASAFGDFAPILAEMFHEGAFLYMSDLQKIAYRQPSNKFDMPTIPLGYQLTENDIAYKTMKSKQPIITEIDD